MALFIGCGFFENFGNIVIAFFAGYLSKKMYMFLACDSPAKAVCKFSVVLLMVLASPWY